MMNPLRGHKINTNSSHLNAGRKKFNEERDDFSQYSRYTEAQAVRSGDMGADVRRDRPRPSSQTSKDPDGQLYEPDKEEDPELKRKRIELQLIEERILMKKASLALKNVDPHFKMMSSGSDEEEGQKTRETLRDRVNTILKQTHSRGFLFKVQPPKISSNPPTRRQDDHPLKLRVESLLRCRFTDQSGEAENSEAPFVSTLPEQNITSPSNAESNANKGFMRFLDILNKGVDFNFLNKIVNDDRETLPTSKDTSGPSSSPEHRLSQTDSREKNGVTSCHDEKRLKSQSRPSPSAKKIKKEEHGQPPYDEQQKTLQNVLQSLGLSLEVDEMSRLTDRTQERLYGKKQYGQEKSDGEEEAGKEKYSPGHYTRSSSCSSSGSSTSTRSSSSSPGPSCRSTETINHTEAHRQYQTSQPQTNAYSYNYTVPQSFGGNYSSTHPQYQYQPTIHPYSQMYAYSAPYNNAHYLNNYVSTDPAVWPYNYPFPNFNTCNSILQNQHRVAPEANTHYARPLNQKWGLGNCDFSCNTQPRCLITVKQLSLNSTSEQYKQERVYRQLRKERKKRYNQRKRLKNNTTNIQERQEKNKRRRKGRKQRKFVEMTKAELEAKRSGPTTRSRTKKGRPLPTDDPDSGLKLVEIEDVETGLETCAESGGVPTDDPDSGLKLVEIEDVETGLETCAESGGVPTDDSDSGLKLVKIEDVETGLETCAESGGVPTDDSDSGLKLVKIEDVETGLETCAESGGQCVVTDKAQTEERHVRTDEEIKANLKIKLAAFNRRMKQLPEPTSCPTTHNSNAEDEI